ncbi:MAG: cob(I)yrinic acid a,c-diamide adenosyltransferase [Tissierella sp.]|nr:cob(I)yrinic acid a,c-diamide adenosyltransferase [Tissierella sp.]
MNIYTKTGDKGETSLFDSKRVSKDDIRVESYGTIDELGSWIGLTKNYVEDDDIYHILQNIQNKLFTVASNLATEDQTKIKHHIMDEDIADLEKTVDFYMGKLNNPKGFIVTGSSKRSAYLHVARTVCRRGERRIISLSKVADINPLVIKYVNRLSDTLYAIARFLEEDQVEVKY